MGVHGSHFFALHAHIPADESFVASWDQAPGRIVAAQHMQQLCIQVLLRMGAGVVPAIPPRMSD